MNDWEEVKKLPPAVFVKLIKFALWAAKGCDEFGLELAYQDDELIMFRRTKPLSEEFKDGSAKVD